MACQKRKLNWQAIKNALRLYSVTLESFGGMHADGMRSHCLCVHTRGDQFDIRLWIRDRDNDTKSLVDAIRTVREDYEKGVAWS